MTSALENLCGPGKALRAEPPDTKEVSGLIRSGRARLPKCHEVRNLGEYEGNLDVDQRLLDDLIQAAKAVDAALRKDSST